MDELINVVGVCGSVAKIYGLPYNGVRPLLEIKQFNNYGAAKLFADEYEDKQRQNKQKTRH